MTISKTPRRDLAQGSPDCGPDALARANTVRWDFTDKPTQRQLDDALARAMADDNIIVPAPPQPWSELAKAAQLEAHRQRVDAWQESAWRNDFELGREAWIDWRAVGIGIAVALVGGVFFAGASLLLTGAVFGLNPVELAADIRSVLR